MMAKKSFEEKSRPCFRTCRLFRPCIVAGRINKNWVPFDEENNASIDEMYAVYIRILLFLNHMKVARRKPGMNKILSFPEPASVVLDYHRAETGVVAKPAGCTCTLPLFLRNG